jgi:membrane-associated phospholipid phosphatase
MVQWRLEPTKLDFKIAQTIARHATPVVEKPLRVMTLAADENLLLVISGVLWLATRREKPARRRAVDQLALGVLVTTVLPHVMKHLVSQQRPDRRMIGRHRHGVPISGKAYDAFPSGHAMHVGAIASSVAHAYPEFAPTVWTIGGTLATSRIVLLAHWTTDVVIGFAAGIMVEHAIRKAIPEPAIEKNSIDVDYQEDKTRAR